MSCLLKSFSVASTSTVEALQTPAPRLTYVWGTSLSTQLQLVPWCPGGLRAGWDCCCVELFGPCGRWCCADGSRMANIKFRLQSYPLSLASIFDACLHYLCLLSSQFSRALAVCHAPYDSIYSASHSLSCTTTTTNPSLQHNIPVYLTLYTCFIDTHDLFASASLLRQHHPHDPTTH